MVSKKFVSYTSKAQALTHSTCLGWRQARDGFDEEHWRCFAAYELRKEAERVQAGTVSAGGAYALGPVHDTDPDPHKLPPPPSVSVLTLTLTLTLTRTDGFRPHLRAPRRAPRREDVEGGRLLSRESNRSLVL